MLMEKEWRKLSGKRMKEIERKTRKSMEQSRPFGTTFDYGVGAQTHRKRK